MRKGTALVALVVVAVAGVLAMVMVCTAGIWWAAPRVLGAGPDGIELRPTPGVMAPESVLPGEVAGYTQTECRKVASYRGLVLGPDAAEATYDGTHGSVRVIAARMDSYHDAATAVRDLAQILESTGVLDSHRLLAEEPYKGWWSASGKRNFAFWYDPEAAVDQRGLVWQNGRWCFIVAANHPIARRDVTLAFPY